MIGYGEESTRLVLDQIVSELTKLGQGAQNDPPLTFDAVKAWPIFAEGSQLSSNDITGFDTPMGNVWRTDIKPKGERHREWMSLVYDKDTREIVAVEVGGKSTGEAAFRWNCDRTYGAWLAYGADSWAAERAFDVRFLTMEEIQTLVAITGRVVRDHPGHSTRVSYHFRVTQDQAQDIFALKDAATYDSYRALNLFTWFQRGPQENAGQRYSDIFRIEAPDELSSASERILDMFDRLNLCVPDFAALRDAVENRRDYWTKVKPAEAPKTNYLVVADMPEREGFDGGWPLSVFKTRAKATAALSTAQYWLAIKNNSLDPKAVSEALDKLYGQFPRLARDHMLDCEDVFFAIEEVDAG